MTKIGGCYSQLAIGEEKRHASVMDNAMIAYTDSEDVLDVDAVDLALGGCLLSLRTDSATGLEANGEDGRFHHLLAPRDGSADHAI